MRALCFVLVLIAAGLPAAASAGRPRIELPQARFSIGDDPAWARREFADDTWRELSTLQNYEKQGYEGYDGYSWYRFHVVIPSSLKASVHWQTRLRIYLSSVDDVDETYLNGVKIGATGRMPGDPRGYATSWNSVREYFVDLSTGLVHFDADNVIAVRVYDGGGGGGFYRDMPYISMAESTDGLTLDPEHTEFRFDRARVAGHVHWVNSFPVDLEGLLHSEVHDLAAGKIVASNESSIRIAAGGALDLPLQAPQRMGIEVRYHFTESGTGSGTDAVLPIPYILTPTPAASPQINGASVLGARPDSPLYFRIAATGEAPLRITASGLPAGLTFDAQRGVLSGKISVPGVYSVGLTAKNAQGTAVRVLSIHIGQQLMLTPPMGWNSWTAYGLDVDSSRVRAAADALLSSGLAQHGWSYINIDDGWEADARGADGQIRSNSRFPDMAQLSEYLHSNGLRFGTYSSPGPLTCGRFLGSLGHERQDADTYSQWGVDYLKYDLCSYADRLAKNPPLADQQAPYRLMAAALAAQPRDIAFSLCQYGNADVWTWGQSVGGNLWRTTGDIEDTWPSVRSIMAAQDVPAPYAGPGHWNDPDTLVVGLVGWGGALHPSRLTPDEQYSQISLWALLAAPLLLGNDLNRLDAFTRSLLTNDEVIAVDQDPLGEAARMRWSHDDWEIWVRRLTDGRTAVGIFNFAARYRSLDGVGKILPEMAGESVRDLWRQQGVGRLGPGFAAQVPAHGVILLAVGRSQTTF